MSYILKSEDYTLFNKKIIQFADFNLNYVHDTMLSMFSAASTAQLRNVTQRPVACEVFTAELQHLMMAFHTVARVIYAEPKGEP